jgi:hypothetical protein
LWHGAVPAASDVVTNSAGMKFTLIFPARLRWALI